MENEKTLFDRLVEYNSKLEQMSELKEILKIRYTENTSCEILCKIFNNCDNYEICETDLFNYPPVCIVKDNIYDETVGSRYGAGIHYFENEDGTKSDYHIITLSESLYNEASSDLLRFVLAHELGHYRRKHSTATYADQGERNILREIEADLYACDIIGLEGYLNGVEDYVKLLISKNIHGPITELMNRSEYIARKFNVNGVMYKFKCTMHEDSESKG